MESLTVKEKSMVINGLIKLHDSKRSLFTNEEIRKLIEKISKF